MTAELVQQLAGQCGFELAGVADAVPLTEAAWYRDWVERGFAGEMAYLTGQRAQMRADPRSLLPSVRSIICLGKLYNRPEPYSTQFEQNGRSWISRYAWGLDYHSVIRDALRLFVKRLAEASPRPFEWKICIDTAPLMERAYARRAGLGWIGKNTCLINQGKGSWFFLAEVLISLQIEAGMPPPDRCGSCTRCIDACPTGAIVATGRSEGPSHTVDSRLCISYLTIELRGEMPEALQPGVGRHVFGCDLCQDVCPWNRKAPSTSETAFAAVHFAPPLGELASLSEEDFGKRFRRSAVQRAGYAGFLRNVAVALRNTKSADN